MPRPLFITGEAGSGKTTKLMEQAAILGSELLVEPHQRALAIAVMHGARWRLQTTLSQHCPQLRVTVSTIHSFALGVVNRWRRSLGLSLPVTACETSSGLSEKHWRTQATFEELMQLACKALDSPTVRRTLSSTYPLVIVDEFQDCAGGTLGFVQALSDTSTVLLAADHFQKLQDVSEGCPSVEWAEFLKHSGAIRYEDLAGCRRTDDSGLLRAARALRENAKASGPTVPVYYAPDVGPAACRIVGRFTAWQPQQRITIGTCALIALSLDDPLLRKLLDSFGNQLAKRNAKRRVQWSRMSSETEQHKQVITELGLKGTGGIWQPAPSISGHLANAVARDAIRFCKLRGAAEIPEELVGNFAKVAVHNARAFGWSSPQFQVLTVHSAKNREFDHVFVFWAYKAGSWPVEEQQRLLYNAVTRAKRDCTVLVLGDRKRTEDDPVIRLLGPAQPAIDPAWGKGKKKKASKSHAVQKS